METRFIFINFNLKSKYLGVLYLLRTPCPPKLSGKILEKRSVLKIVRQKLAKFKNENKLTFVCKA
jgi:hypothetical protein